MLSDWSWVCLWCASVVQEAVEFCVTVCEFSVANSLTGVRKMLPLVWSTDAAIKDAVVQAYRRLYLNPQGDSTRWVCTAQRARPDKPPLPSLRALFNHQLL